jgi:hypothetical protein
MMSHTPDNLLLLSAAAELQEIVADSLARVTDAVKEHGIHHPVTRSAISDGVNRLNHRGFHFSNWGILAQILFGGELLND